MTYPKLKPCPKCGQEPFLFGYEGWNGQVSSWRVECDPCPGTPCGFYIGSCEGRKLDAIRAYNELVGKLLSEKGKKVSVVASSHDDDCEWHHEQVAAECTCRKGKA